MKCVFTVVIFCVIFAIAFAAVSQGKFEDPAHPGKCVIDKDTILSAGESAPHGDCGKVSCSEGSSAIFVTCGVEGPPPGCKLGDFEDSSKDYPECCKRKIIC